MSPFNDRSYEPFSVTIPADVERDDRILANLTARQLAILIPAILAAILSSQADQVDPNAGSTALGNLRSIGIPTSGDEWAKIGTIVGLGSLLAMLVGSVLGGILGERWHSKQPRPVHTETRTVVDQPTGHDRDRSDDDGGATRMASPDPDRARRQA